MCFHRSFIVTKDERILCHPQSDHHTDIRREYGIPELKDVSDDRHVSVECVPVHSLFDLGGWKVKLDQPNKPEWYDKYIEKKVLDKMVSEFNKRAVPKSSVYTSDHDLEFGFLEKYESGSVIRSGDTIVLRGFKVPVRDVVFKAKRIVILEDRHRFYGSPFEDCVFSCNELICHSHQLNEYLHRSGQYNNINDRLRYEERVRHSDRFDAWSSLTATAKMVQQNPFI